MAIRAIVFDFDGTLVDSNELKYNAFFSLFPSNAICLKIIKEVLAEFLEETRFVILREILQRLENKNIKESEIEAKVLELADKYNENVVSLVKNCREMPRAEEALKKLGGEYSLYLSSTTPKESLVDIVKFRKWERYFVGIFGRPNTKISTLYKIMDLGSFNPSEILVVGDGVSDKESALKTGCRFFDANKDGGIFKDLLNSASKCFC